MSATNRCTDSQSLNAGMTTQIRSICPKARLARESGLRRTPTIELTPRGQSASLSRVTGSEHGLGNTSDAAGSRAKRALSARVWEWFWRGAALSELAAALPKRGERAFSWMERAK